MTRKKTRIRSWLPGSSWPGRLGSPRAGWPTGCPAEASWRSWLTPPPGTMTGIRGRRTRSWTGRSPRGTGSRPMPPRASTSPSQSSSGAVRRRKDTKDMPARWDEFAVDELRVLLAESKSAVERMMDRALALAQRLPGTMALYRSGKLRQSKVTIIVDVTGPLDDHESRAAEEKVLGRASRLTPSGLRDAAAKAVMDVAPEKTKKRREDAAKDARVERWAED